ncbi:MAG: cob(I)yrinic acid a,c-diamide adenosyltransferase [Flavobacteriaceae bacterium]|nr:cob(I)yrinic acid a,c-diamide adenosyltransferase [Flavobacteriaceae bacterium]
MAFKIYTKTGDQGETSLIGGTRVPKHHIRIEAYGTVDELNSHIGLVRDTQTEAKVREILKEIQDRLFTLGSNLAADPGKSKMVLPEMLAEDVERLEKEIDRMDETLPELKNFVLPGGHVHVSYCHLARCVCRRAERLSVHLAENEPVEPLAIQYLNRLSDYLFALGRYTAHQLGAEEVEWRPRG